MLGSWVGVGHKASGTHNLGCKAATLVGGRRGTRLGQRKPWSDRQHASNAHLLGEAAVNHVHDALQCD